MSGRPFSPREKAIVYSCLNFFEEEKVRRTKIHGNEPALRVAEALGISRRSVFVVKKEMEKEETSPRGASADASEPRSKHRCGRRPIEIDDFLRGCIRREVHSFFARKEFPTLAKILQACRDNIEDFPDMSATTLWRTLKKMGFKYKKRGGAKSIHERPDVVAKRCRFLREIRQLRAQGRLIVYLDET